jgi:hypothetical protein
MNQPPKFLDDAQVLYHCPVDPEYDKNPRFKKGFIASMAICTYDQRSFYLFYCDTKWKVLSDTFHDSVDKAMAQAKVEFPEMQIHWHRIV